MSFERALITGATSGIGRALACLLGEKKIKLILTGRNREALFEVADLVNAEEVIVADIHNSQERERLVEMIEKKVPDLVVNNAGFTFYGDPLSLTVEEQLAIADVNAMVPLEFSLVAARTLVAHGKRGVVMNISSVAGEYPCPGMAVYGASKSFVTRFSQAMNTELAPHGISILVSCPGMVATSFAHRAARKKIDHAPGSLISVEEAAQEIWEQIVKRKEKHIFNWQYRLALFVANIFVPVSLIKKIIWKSLAKRK